ncbi:transporter substrate-binding domain-containing protein [Micromonospora radicis]|uniref:Glutamate ABC transporter substrate-binding protein n=1 Tax=Micromonospora radicis TaxID=1894971 RepID=A0A418N1R0_9ACTN|nr:transporter substrate-binding domain-containing protein [Micromonospora radicis]RIV41441.1 glutamate ABC transporter substrate-binding protein [Micromonospora radicis]
MRRLRLAALILLLVVAVVAIVRAVSVAGPPSRAQLREQAGLTGKQELLIGVKDDQPRVSQLLEGGTFAGFDIEIAYLIAEDLGFEAARVKFLPIESEDRARRQARTPDGRFVTVDLVVASYSITAKRREQGVIFSAPYLQTEQSVVTLKSGGLRPTTFADLAGKKVCTLATSTAEQNLTAAGAQAHGRNRISQCIQELYDGEIDAVTTDAAILAGFVAPPPVGDLPPMTKLTNPKPLHHADIGADGDELWGVNTGPDPAMRDLVNLSLEEARTGRNGKRWQAAFDKYFGHAQQYNVDQQVAVDRQPPPAPSDKVEVRRWPWERFALPDPNRPRPAPSPGAARVRARRNSGC